MNIRSSISRVAAFALLITQGGCYVYTRTLSGQPTPGARYAFELTDQGRVGLADRLGPGIERVEGTLVERDSLGYLVRVAAVSTIGAGTSHWSGERVAIRPDYVGRMYERSLSRGRTATAITAAAVAVGTFIATRGLWGSGGPTATAPGGSQGGQ